MDIIVLFETAVELRLRLFSGLFWPIFDSKEPKNRQQSLRRLNDR
jgi:hypothetical protein